jgi:putative colanic acid biosynthesis UDP-glucose lipid carrier transferase
VTVQDYSQPATESVLPPFNAFGLAAERPHVTASRIMDLAIAFLVLVLCLPILGLIALAIRLDSRGPLIFRQRRAGQGGRMFSIYKFRSMHVMEDGAQIAQATKGDARVTRVGRFLRASSLDELPQLFNVLAGEMALVGPRPHALAHDEYYSARISNYRVRHLVKPGITGWAQVQGLRGATKTVADMQARITLDAWYVAHQSIWLDFIILARTPLEVLRRRNAV